ncbi:hypothetical protein F2Q68_00011785 [Brassica cretica]|uniref:Uncharacterized protein n=1 Tax=Brassica cretica TaxID=69181 RepID=A0A8S9KS06_BRACR|nr:hypothetical protein F2Q68_00011785 [Brassica cretica]
MAFIIKIRILGFHSLSNNSNSIIGTNVSYQRAGHELIGNALIVRCVLRLRSSECLAETDRELRLSDRERLGSGCNRRDRELRFVGSRLGLGY